MAKFLKGNLLNAAVEEIFDNCDRQLIIVSPYIKLHNRFINSLKSKKNNDKLHIQILFGKNEKDISKSINHDDFQFLKDFPNIEIRYNQHLHAKYYSNDSKAILSSMNLYDYSQNNNIEFGILTNASIIDNLTGQLTRDNLDNNALEYFQQVITDSELLYEKKPRYESKYGGLQKVYSDSEVIVDKLTDILNSTGRKFKKPKFVQTVTAATKENRITGYCIRTGEEIEFNPEKPMSTKAFHMWSKYGDKEYQEKYCHYSGEPSHGETNFARPILKKNWKKAMKN